MNREEANRIKKEVSGMFQLADEMLNEVAESGNITGGHDTHERLMMTAIISQTRLMSLAGGNQDRVFRVLESMNSAALRTQGGISEVMSPSAKHIVSSGDRRPADAPTVRVPKFALGASVEFDGRRWVVLAIYADYWAAIDSFAVPPGWFEAQKPSPSTKDQLFYVLSDDFVAIVVGENELSR